VAWLAAPVRSALRARMDPGRYNGGSLLGLRGIVIKSHGSADVYAFGQALERAVEEVRKRRFPSASRSAWRSFSRTPVQ